MYHLKIEGIKKPNSELPHTHQKMDSENVVASLSQQGGNKSRLLKEKEQEQEDEGNGVGDIKLKVAVGNPEIEVTQGIMHLYKEVSINSPAKRGQLPVRPPLSLSYIGR